MDVLSADGCLPCQLARSTRQSWVGVIGVEGELTGDGRLIERDALRWENLPLPLRYVARDVGGHDNAEVIGTIDTIERREDGSLAATGTIDLGSEIGQEAARQVGEGLTTGVSMDLDDVSFEVRVAAEVIDEIMVDSDLPEPDEDGRIKVGGMDSDAEVRVTTSGRIRAATVVAIPAFANAKIELTEDIVEEDVEDVTAGAVPILPPAAWFSDPKLSKPTPLVVKEDGRVYGHLATWHVCHTSHTNSCVTAPRSASGYAYFATGTVLTAEGSEFPTGRITLDTKHAGPKLSAASASSHYEHTGYAVADVTAGEDEHGIWVAGALRPSVTPEQVRSLRAAPLSGDWRRIGGNLELVAALAVNVPGFPIPRPSGLVAGGVVQSLVASGLVPPRKVRRPGTPGALSEDDLRYLKRLVERERMSEHQQTADLASKVRAFAMKRRVLKTRPDGTVM